MYTVVPDLIDAARYQEFLDEARSILAPHAESSARAEFGEVALSMSALCHKLPEQYLAAMRVIGKLASLHAVLKHDSVETYLKKKCAFDIITMCGQPVLHVSGKPVCVENFDADVAWHQDWPNTGGSKNSIVLWLPLGGCDPKEGGLTLAEGETFPLLDYIIDSKVCRIRDSIADDLVAKYEAPPWGSGIFFDQFHPHCSSSGSNVRLAVSFRYEDAGCRDWRRRGFEYLHQRSKVSREFAEWQ